VSVYSPSDHDSTDEDAEDEDVQDVNNTHTYIFLFDNSFSWYREKLVR
jgi:hypothetical protein